MSDTSSCGNFLAQTQPDEIYNLAAQSHVGVSFETPEYTAQTAGIGTLRILEAIRTNKNLESARFYQASTSELFGGKSTDPYTELSNFAPESPYAASKLFAHWTTINYRNAYNLWAANGILFNHESPRRGETFVTRKITRGLARIKYGLQEHLILGNLDARRDWGHAKDYVNAMWLMLQQETPQDYVIATGISHSVREFVEAASKMLDLEITWQGVGINECGVDAKGKVLVKVHHTYFRPNEVDSLIGDSAKAHEQLGWKASTSFEDLIKEMVAHDEQLSRSEARLT
jgi:GDPmannose 4,6-dehydratase